MFDDVSRKLRRETRGFLALALIGLDGRIGDLEVGDPEFDREALTEFATLLRIAHSTTEDTPGGGLSEMSWRSDRSLVLMSRVTSDQFLVFFGNDEVQTGHLRYLLRREARRLSTESERPTPTGPESA